MKPTVDILLATYNSAGYLREQIDSILSQTYRNWRLLIRDAGSHDETCVIIDEYCKRDSRIQLVEVGAAKACENFSRLMEFSTSDYVMFCDHDDVWLPEKIELSYKAMQELEEEANAKEIPLLVFSDTVVTDGALNVLDESSFHYQNLDPSRIAPQQLFFQNVAAGNTMLLNRALVKLCNPIPHSALMHDHWVMLVASLMGRIKKIPGRGLLLYRQHSNNVLGANMFSFSQLSEKLLKKRDGVKKRLRDAVDQGKILYERYGNAPKLSSEHREMLKAFASLYEKSYLQRRMILFRYGIWKCGLLRNLGMLIFI